LGEAPQLTSTYAQYDDGSQVFSAYVNGNTPVTQFNLGTNIALAQATGVAYGSGTINALHLTGTGTDVTIVYNGVALANVPLTAESNFETQSVTTSQGAVALDDNVNPGSSQNAIAVDLGYGSSYFSNAYELGGAYTFDQNQQGAGATAWLYSSVSYSGSSAVSWTGYITPELYVPSTGYSGTVNNNPLGSASSIYLSVLSSAGAAYPDNMYYNWMRARISLPNGVMPTATFGSIVTQGATSTATTVGTSSAQAQSYIPITFTNSQTSATPNPFQQQLTWNPSTYAAYEASNLGNIRFCTTSSCGTQLYAWLQQCGTSITVCSSSSTSAVAWVRLTSSIAANGGTLTIYMVFLPTSTNFDGNYWGEAPTLSGTYAQYDNGANVFTIYDNFAAGTLSGNWNQITYRGSVNPGNGITFTTTRSSGYSFIWWNTVQVHPQVAETYVTAVGGGTDPMLGVSTTGNNNGYTSLYNGISVDWVQGANSITLASQTSGGGTVRGTATVSGTFTQGIWGVTWSATNSETGTAQGGTATGTNSPTIGNYAIFLGMSNTGTGSGSVSMTWARMRAYPPNNAMPGVSFGTFVSGSSSATSYSFEHKVFYSQGLWWAFYSDGTNIGYSTSDDGFSWSSETVLTSSSGSSMGYDFNIWISGNTFYYVLTSNGQSNSFLWRYGTLQSSGSITWAIPETTVTTTNTVYSYNSVITDSSGNVWVALNTNDGTNTHIEVWKYSGAWSKVKDISPLPSDATPILLSLSSGVALIYGEGSVTAATDITATTTGITWSSVVVAPSNYLLFSSSATSIGNTVYFAGLSSASTGATTGTVGFWSYSMGATTTSSQTTLQSSTSNWMAAISEEASGTLIVFYGAGTNIYVLSSVSSGAIWSSIASISASETSVTGLTSAIGGSAAIWTSGSSSPFSVRFAAVPTISITNNSPFAVNLVSLYIYNLNANTLIHFDVNPTGQGVIGTFNYWLGAGETMSVPLLPFTWQASNNYLLTLAASNGVLTSYTVTSPS
jgi:hypothetical protein